MVSSGLILLSCKFIRFYMDTLIFSVLEVGLPLMGDTTGRLLCGLRSAHRLNSFSSTMS